MGDNATGNNVPSLLLNDRKQSCMSAASAACGGSGVVQTRCGSVVQRLGAFKLSYRNGTTWGFPSGVYEGSCTFTHVFRICALAVIYFLNSFRVLAEI